MIRLDRFQLAWLECSRIVRHGGLSRIANAEPVGKRISQRRGPRLQHLL